MSHSICGQASLELSVDPADVVAPTDSSIEESPDGHLGVAIVLACFFPWAQAAKSTAGLEECTQVT